MKLILISGKAESGKDTIANFIMEMANVENVNIVTHIADIVKIIAKKDFGWTGVKDVRGRALLQMIGDGGRQYNPDIWINHFLDLLDSNKEAGLVIVPDVRYKNEVKKLLEWGDRNGIEVITVRVERPDHENKLTAEQRENGSEVDLDDWGIWDVKIINDSTKEALRATIENALEVLKVGYKP